MIIYIYICYAKTFIIVREIWGAISICVIACFKQITRLWNSRYANCSTWNETNGVHQDLYTNSDFMLTVRSGTRPDLPDFAVLGILVWAMTSQGHRTIRKWCSPASNGYSFSRQMFMAKEDGGSIFTLTLFICFKWSDLWLITPSKTLVSGSTITARIRDIIISDALKLPATFTQFTCFKQNDIWYISYSEKIVSCVNIMA